MWKRDWLKEANCRRIYKYTGYMKCTWSSILESPVYLSLDKVCDLKLLVFSLDVAIPSTEEKWSHKRGATVVTHHGWAGGAYCTVPVHVPSLSDGCTTGARCSSEGGGGHIMGRGTTILKQQCFLFSKTCRPSQAAFCCTTTGSMYSQFRACENGTLCRSVLGRTDHCTRWFTV